MGGQETINNLYATAIENTSLQGSAIPVTTFNGSYGTMVMRQGKPQERILLPRIKIGIDKKATHKWNK